MFVSDVYGKQTLVEREPEKSVWRNIYLKVRLALGQSVVLVGESLHNDTGFTPGAFMCEKSLMRTLVFVEKSVHVIVLITVVNEGGFIKVFI